MTTTMQHAPATGAASDFPRSQNRGISFRHLADAYMAAYTGRDHALPTRLAWWVARFGDRPTHELTDDEVFHAIEELAAGDARTYAGKDADGRPILRSRGKRSPGR